MLGRTSFGRVCRLKFGRIDVSDHAEYCRTRIETDNVLPTPLIVALIAQVTQTRIVLHYSAKDGPWGRDGSPTGMWGERGEYMHFFRQDSNYWQLCLQDAVVEEPGAG